MDVDTTHELQLLRRTLDESLACQKRLVSEVESLRDDLDKRFAARQAAESDRMLNRLKLVGRVLFVVMAVLIGVMLGRIIDN